MPTTLTPLVCALAYASRGWHVFPVYEMTPGGICSCSKGANCHEKARGKHPRTAHGGIVKLLGLRRSSGKRVPLPGPRTL
jgi:hypothetical protein